MARPSHTPGPWRPSRPFERWDMGADGCTPEPTGLYDVWIGKPALGGFASAFGPDPDQVIANARLIAAAPELLEMARDCLAVLEAGELKERIIKILDEI